MRLLAAIVLVSSISCTNQKLAHLSATSLSWLAKRRGDVLANVSSWCKLIRTEKLRPLLPRIYPRTPNLGIRAKGPCEIWHIDITLIRLANGTRAFMQAIIDNASRYIVAFHVTDDYGGLRTKSLLERARAFAKTAGYHLVPNVFCDSGVENLNADVDGLVEAKAIQRTVAQLDVAQSNSMVEAFFRRLKHAWLFTNPLTDLETVAGHTKNYVTDHNQLIPHYALSGATPAEIFFATW